MSISIASVKNKLSPKELRRFAVGLLLILFAVWTAISVISHNYTDYHPYYDGIIYPPPRPINNLGGPAGAMASKVLIDSFGYLSVFAPVLLLIWGILRLAKASRKDALLATGEVIAGHGIVAALLALPGGSLSQKIAGNYGLALAHSMKSTFGSIGAYFIGILLFLFFIAIVIRPDAKDRIIAAIRKTIERRRRAAVHKAEETIPKEKGALDHEESIQPTTVNTGITGSIISREKRTPTKPDTKKAEPTPELSEPSEPINDGRATRMEYIPPPIRRTDQETIKPTQPPPPPPERTIDPKKLLTEKQPADSERLPQKEPAPSSTKGEEQAPNAEPKIGHEPPLPEPIPLEEQKKPTSASQKEIKDSGPKKPEEKPKPKVPYKYTPPSLDILTHSAPESSSSSDINLHQQAQRLIETLKSFNVEGEIKEICPGPVITRYELEPAVGVKVSRIANLADDIALALKAQDIRIVAPIPGKGAVGIEVPNEEIQTVRIRSVLGSETFRKSKYPLPLSLGKRVDGSPAIVDLEKMPHLLIAGATGSGKSVCINSIITSLVYAKSPEELRLILIDPKRLELSVYDGIPHLTAPIVVEPKHASLALQWAVDEMDARYQQLSTVGVRSIADYNDHVERFAEEKDGAKTDIAEQLKKLPYVVVVIDELADLMVLVSSEIEEPIARLAQMARAVGIHLVIATQRPSVDVITGLIKANFPSRIAFKVRSKVDSRTILDMGGAERLLGQGDMLYLPSGYAEPIRIHGSLITTEETEHIVSYLRTFPNPFPDDMLDFEEQEEAIAAAGEQDELFWEAAKVVVMYQQGSTSFLQRKLRVGYTRAGCIIDQLADAKIVGPHQGSKAREVLVDNLETLEELKEQLEASLR